jgi:hypothetical protein
MRYFLLIFVAMALVGCGKKETDQIVAAKLIADPIVEKAIREELKKPTGELTVTDLNKVKELDLENKELTDVPNGLDKLTNLKVLYLSRNKLTDVRDLEKLTQVKNIILSVNSLTDVKGLEKLTQLEGLNLSNNKLTDVAGLGNLTNLWVLRLELIPDLTKAQIAELQKALPKCKIWDSVTFR